MPRKKNTCSARELLSMEHEKIGWKNERFSRLIGEDAEPVGSWIIWGMSGNGKSSFAVQLVEELSMCGVSVLYVSLEEGFGKTMQTKVKPLTRLKNVRFITGVDREGLEKELNKQRSARCVVVDSLQYLGINKAGYTRLKNEYPEKLFVWISHANEKEQPQGVGNAVRYDANVKILVSKYVAQATTRYVNGGEPYTIWTEKSNELMNKEEEK